MLPDYQAHALLLRFIDDAFQLRVAPAVPEAFDDLVFESQLAGQLAEISDAFERVFPAIDVAPDGAPALAPVDVDAFREELRIGRRTAIGNHVAVDQRVEICAHQHDTPRR